MFCQNCGANIPDGSRFCEKCGSPVEAQPNPAPAADDYDATTGAGGAPAYGYQPQAPAAPEYAPQPQYTAQPQYAPQAEFPGQQYQPYNGYQQPAADAAKKKKLKLIIGIGAAVAVVALAVILILVFTAPQSRAEAFLKEYLKIYTGNANSDKILKYEYSDKMLGKVAALNNMDTNALKTSVRQSVESMMSDARSSLNGHSLSFKVKYKSSRAATDDDTRSISNVTVDGMKQRIQQMFGSNPSAIRMVTFDVDVNLDGNTSTVEAYVLMYCYEGVWYAGAANDSNVTNVLTSALNLW